MKQKIMGAFQNFSRAIIQPIMFLSVTGTILALSVILKLDFMPSIVKSIGDFLYNLMMNGNMNQLSIIFCVGLSVALAKQKKADAALVGLMSYLLFIYANNAWLTITGTLAESSELGLIGTGQAMNLGVQTIDMGVFLGIILGCVSGYVFNKLSNIEFPDAVKVYGGSRLAFMAMIPVTIIMAIGLSYIWPVVNSIITAGADFMSRSGAFGVFIYGFLNRVLIPTGLHHLVYTPFVFSPLGGTATIAGQTASGAMQIWMTQLGNIGSITSLHESVRFMTFGFSKVFGCIGIALAFIKTAKPENKAKTKGIIIPALFLAIIAGITEPFEFSFLFISPLLWVIHSVFDGLFQALAYALGSRAVLLGGVIDLITSNLPVPIRLSKVYILIILGFIAIAVWYFTFTFFIKKLNIKTPGREDVGEEVSLASRNIEEAKIKSQLNSITEEKGVDKKGSDMGDIIDIINGLGGPDNIVAVNNCFTRLRVDVKDTSLVNDDTINKFKNSGIAKNGNNIQIIIGMKVQTVREDICKYLGID